jgi:hypothetical protein
MSDEKSSQKGEKYHHVSQGVLTLLLIMWHITYALPLLLH